MSKFGQILCPKCNLIPILSPYFENFTLKIKSLCLNDHIFYYNYQNFLAKSLNVKKKMINTNFEKCKLDNKEAIGICIDCNKIFCIYCKEIHNYHKKNLIYEMLLTNEQKIKFNTKIFEYKKNVKKIKELNLLLFNKINIFLKNIEDYISLMDNYYELYDELLKEKNLNINFLFNFKNFLDFPESDSDKILKKLNHDLLFNFHYIDNVFEKNKNFNKINNIIKKNDEKFNISKYNIITKIKMKTNYKFIILNDKKILSYKNDLLLIYEKNTFEKIIEINFNKLKLSVDNNDIIIKKIYQLKDNRILIFCKNSFLFILQLLINNKCKLDYIYSNDYFKFTKNIIQLYNNKILITSNRKIKLFDNNENISFLENIQINNLSFIQSNIKYIENDFNDDDKNNEIFLEDESNKNNNFIDYDDSYETYSNDSSGNNSDSEKSNSPKFIISFITEMNNNNIFLVENHSYYSLLKGLLIDKEKILLFNKKISYKLPKKYFIKLSNVFICYIVNKKFHILSFEDYGNIKYIINSNNLPKYIYCSIFFNSINTLLIGKKNILFQYKYEQNTNKIKFIEKYEIENVYKICDILKLNNQNIAISEYYDTLFILNY